MLSDGNRVFLAVLLMGLAMLAVSILLPTVLWSLAGLDATPLSIKIVAGMLLIFSATQVAGRGSEQVARAIQARPKAGRVFGFATGAVILVLMYLFSSENHALGDGYQILGRTDSGIGGSSFATPDFYFHHLISTALSGMVENSALWSYRLVAFVTGIACWVGIWCVTRKWQSTLLAMLLFACCSIVQFYFGYVEHYTIAFTFLVLYMLSAFSDFESDTLSIKTPLLLLAACGFHLLSIVYLPSLVYLAYSRLKKKSQRLLTLAGSISVILVGAIYVSTQTAMASIFVPLFAVTDNPYSLFSGQHLKDLVSVLMLNISLLPVLLLHKATWFGKQRNLILVAITFPLLFTVVFDPKLGAMRDWDILCLAVPAVFAAMLAVLREFESALKYRLIPLLFVFALMHTGTWIYHNASKQESYESVKREIQRDVHYSANYLKGERLLSWAFIAGECYNDDAEIFRAQSLRVMADPADDLTRYNLARNYAIEGDTASAADILAGKWRPAVERPEYTIAASRILEAAHRYAAQEALLEGAPKNPPYSYKIYADLAALKDRRGVVDTACLYYNYALGANPNAPLTDKIGIARYWLKNGYEYEAGALLDDTRTLLTPDALPLLDQVRSAMNKGRISESDSLLRVLQDRIARN